MYGTAIKLIQLNKTYQRPYWQIFDDTYQNQSGLKQVFIIATAFQLCIIIY
jgi:hypothetical protein